MAVVPFVSAMVVAFVLATTPSGRASNFGPEFADNGSQSRYHDAGSRRGHERPPTGPLVVLAVVLRTLAGLGVRAVIGQSAMVDARLVRIEPMRMLPGNSTSTRRPRCSRPRTWDRHQDWAWKSSVWQLRRLNEPGIREQLRADLRLVKAGAVLPKRPA
jgi:hypothetical protein